MLNLAEELLLLTHLDAKGNLYGAESGSLDATVCGGILADLVLSGRIQLTEGSLTVNDGSSTGDQFLDQALAALAPGHTWDPGEPEWLGPLVNSIALGDRMVQGLVYKGILRREEKRTLGIFRGIIYPLQDPAVKKRLEDQERRIMIDGAEPDPRSATLIYLTSICGEADPPKRSRKEKKAYQKRWAELFGDYWGQYPDEHTKPIPGLNPVARKAIGYLAVSLGTIHSAIMMGDASYYDYD